MDNQKIFMRRVIIFTFLASIPFHTTRHLQLFKKWKCLSCKLPAKSRKKGWMEGEWTKFNKEFV